MNTPPEYDRTKDPFRRQEIAWEYGVTTVPTRKLSYLLTTLKSLGAAGFDKPRLFVDGAGTGYGQFGCEVTYRFPRTDLVTNWQLALWELYARNPTADRYAIFQDDVSFVRNLRGYLDRCKWPDQGYLNLTTFKFYERAVSSPDSPRGWFEAPVARCAEGYDPVLRQQGGYGALGLVFDRNAVWALLSAMSFVAKRAAVPDPEGRHGPNRNIDGCIVTALNLAGYREYIHNPSLTTHIGLVSENTCGEHADARTFPGEEFDALTLP